MTGLAEKILDLLNAEPGLTDREITDRLIAKGSAQQPINQAARKLESRKLLKRVNRVDGLIGNYPTGLEPQPTNQSPRASLEREGLSEDNIKTVLEQWLRNDDWRTVIAWGKKPGIDIAAVKSNQKWIIEVKGIGSRPQMRVNYFLAVLGETLQRMADENAIYSIALPDVPQFRRLWERLPALAKERLRISAIFVNDKGEIHHDSSVTIKSATSQGES